MTAALAAVGLVAVLAACGAEEDSGANAADTPSADKFAVAKGEPVGEPGSATPPQWIGEGAVPDGQPDINGDGKVIVGAITSGDIKDGTYYQSIADAVAYAADQHGWEQTVQGLVPLNQAATAAENLCRQKADLIVIGDSQLAQGLSAAKKPACKDTFFYLQGGYGSPEQDDTFTQSYDVGLDYAYVAGVAAGAYMKANDIDSAGFISGIAAPFNTTIGAVFKQGVLAEVPKADVIETYTGDQIDVGKAVEAFGAQQSQGVGLVYPYFGAPTLAVAKKANEAGVPVLGSPSDVCGEDGLDFVGAVVFAPGYYLSPLLDDFAAGELKLGQTKNWRLGVDPVPAVKSCDSAGEHAEAIDEAIKKAQDDINNGRIDPFALAGDGS